MGKRLDSVPKRRYNIHMLNRKANKIITKKFAQRLDIATQR
jgi:hypothetical protein